MWMNYNFFPIWLTVLLSLICGLNGQNSSSISSIVRKQQKAAVNQQMIFVFKFYPPISENTTLFLAPSRNNGVLEIPAAVDLIFGQTRLDVDVVCQQAGHSSVRFQGDQTIIKNVYEIGFSATCQRSHWVAKLAFAGKVFFSQPFFSHFFKILNELKMVF